MIVREDNQEKKSMLTYLESITYKKLFVQNHYKFRLIVLFQDKCLDNKRLTNLSLQEKSGHLTYLFSITYMW